VFRGTTTTDPVIDTAGRFQHWIADGLGQLGTATVAGVFAVLLIIAIVVRRTRRSRRRTGRETPSST
jgi:hypothetical protein